MTDMDRIRKIATWLDIARAGWRTEDPRVVAAWANAKAVTKRPQEIDIGSLAQWIAEQDLLGPILKTSKASPTVVPSSTILAAQTLLEIIRWPSDRRVKTTTIDKLFTALTSSAAVTGFQSVSYAKFAEATRSPAEWNDFGVIWAHEILRARGA